MSGVELFARGRLAALDEASLDHLVERGGTADPALSSEVGRILSDVHARGDAALRELADRYDGADLAELEVPRARWREAAESLDPDVRAALERAAANIRAFHEAQRPSDVSLAVEEGVRVTRTWVPLARVGVYAPGGRAAYPSSVLMGVVPARAAGVDEVVVCSPPGLSGLPPEEVLAAADIAGADRLFALGGAGAIAALTWGTESVPRVDAIVGPGNRWVTEAKRQVAGEIVIDAPAGPSEVLVLADATSYARLVALELVAQAEHDPDTASVLVSTSEQLIGNVETELVEILAETPRAEIVRSALAASGALLWADSLDDAIAFANRYAPEHAAVMTENAALDARRLLTAGTIFVGNAASVAFGDYLTGANHVLPTGGRARSFSGLAVHHFLRSYTLQEIDAAGADSMARDVATLATAEGLPAHAAAALARKIS